MILVRPFHYKLKVTEIPDPESDFTYFDLFGEDAKFTFKRALVYRYMREFMKQGKFDETGNYIIDFKPKWIFFIESHLYRVP